MERAKNTRECGRPTRDINRRDTSFSKCAQLIRPEKLSLERHLNYLYVHVCVLCVLCAAIAMFIHLPWNKQFIFKAFGPWLGQWCGRKPAGLWTVVTEHCLIGLGWDKLVGGYVWDILILATFRGGPTPFLRMLKCFKWIRSKHSHCYHAGSTVHLL